MDPINQVSFISFSQLLSNVLILALFYTFKTPEGHEVSLTSNHGLFVYLPQSNEIHYSRASGVTFKHQLIMLGKTVEIESISLNQRQGYYSPLTLSSYLYVNNISTSVFVDKYERLSCL